MLGPGEGRQKDQLHYSLFTQAATSLTSLSLNVCRTATPYCHCDYSSINLLGLTILNKAGPIENAMSNDGVTRIGS